MFRQLIGTAMGAVPAVSYANIFMARRIDSKILSAAEKYQTNLSLIPPAVLVTLVRS